MVKRSEDMKIAKETAERIGKILKTDNLSISIENKKVLILGEIAILLAGMVDANLLGIGADNTAPIQGEWISVPHKKDRICSVCGGDEPYKFAYENVNVFDYCPHCGVKMKRSEEPEINPCRGCEDYDGRGGCKSNGGCAENRNEDDENWYTELDDPKIAERSEE